MIVAGSSEAAIRGLRIMKKIEDLMGEILGNEGMGDLGDLIRVRNAWESIVGKGIAKKTKPYKLEKGRLYVGAESHAWVQETHYQIEEIKKRIEGETGIEIEEVVVKKINLK